KGLCSHSEYLRTTTRMNRSAVWKHACDRGESRCADWAIVKHRSGASARPPIQLFNPRSSRLRSSSSESDFVRTKLQNVRRFLADWCAAWRGLLFRDINNQCRGLRREHANPGTREICGRRQANARAADCGAADTLR